MGKKPSHLPGCPTASGCGRRAPAQRERLPPRCRASAKTQTSRAGTRRREPYCAGHAGGIRTDTMHAEITPPVLIDIPRALSPLRVVYEKRMYNCGNCVCALSLFVSECVCPQEWWESFESRNSILFFFFFLRVKNFACASFRH